MRSPGTESTQAGLASACAGCANQSICQSQPRGPDPDLPEIKERLKNVKHKILVLSGKGGVGKSTFSVGLGWAFSGDGDNVSHQIHFLRYVIELRLIFCA